MKRGVILFMLLVFLALPLCTAKQPAPDDGNYTFIFEDDYTDEPFVIGAYELPDKKLEKEQIKWVKEIGSGRFWYEFLNDTKYKDDKLKDPLAEIHFYISPELIGPQTCSGNMYYQSCSHKIVSFEEFEAKNNITSRTIEPVYPTLIDMIWNWEWVEFWELKQYMETPLGYMVSYYGVIDDVDPVIEFVYTSTTNGVFNQTDATGVGVGLIFNGTAQTGYNNTDGDMKYWVYYNSTPTYWNVTMEIANDTGNARVLNLCNAENTCISYLSFDDTSAGVLDQKGSNDGSLFGNPNNFTGLSSGAIDLDGTGDGVGLDADALDNLNNSGSFSLWFNADTITGVSNEDLLLNAEGIIVMRVESGKVQGRAYNGTTATYSEYDGISTGNWYYAVLTWDGTNQRLYVNGDLKDTDSQGFPAVDDYSRTSCIGCHWDTSSITREFDGSIDEVLAHNKTLSITEIQALYEMGLAQHANTNITLETRVADDYNLTDTALVSLWGFNNDSTIGENATTVVDLVGMNNGTIYGATWSEENGTVGGGFSFDGTDDAINITDSDSLSFGDGGSNDDPFSISVWAYLTGTDDTKEPIIGRDDEWLLGTGGADLLSFALYDGPVSNENIHVDLNNDWATEIGFNTWVHIVGVYDGSEAETGLDLYINGVKPAQTQVAGGGVYSAMHNQAVPTEIGGWAFDGRRWHGTIDEVRIYNDTLSAAEIKDLYELGQSNILWDDWKQERTVVDNTGMDNNYDGKFFQFRSGFYSNSTAASPYLLNHSISQIQEGGTLETNFTLPTVLDNSYQRAGDVYVNVSSAKGDGDAQHSVIVDWNKTLRGWWRLEEGNGTLFNDSSTWGNNGTCNFGAGNCPAYTDFGALGGAYSFDGTDDFMNMTDPADDSLDFGAEETFTVSAWYKSTATDARIILSKDLFGTGYGLLLDGTVPKVGFRVDDGSNPVAYPAYENAETIDGAWHYVVGVKEATNSWKLYFDGDLKDIDTDTLGTIRNSRNFLVGEDEAQFDAQNWQMDGSIDDVQIYSRALTSHEINATYNATSFQYQNNFTSLGSGNYSFKACGQDLAGNLNCTLERNVFVDSTVPEVNFTLPTLADGSSTTGTSLIINVSSFDNQGQHSVIVDWNKTLVGWWRMERGNGTFFVDNSSYGNNGTCNFGAGECPIYTNAGKLGGGYSFDGTDDFINAGQMSALWDGVNTQMSTSLWFKRQATGVIDPLVCKYDTPGAVQVAYFFVIQADNTIRLIHYASDSPNHRSETITDVAAVTDTGWHHIAHTSDVDTDTIHIYVDGSEVASTTVLTGDGAGVLNSDVVDLWIPRYETGGADVYGQGIMDDVQIYSRALTSHEINATYNATSFQYQNNFSSLGLGNYTVKACGQDLAGNLNCTEEREYEVKEATASSLIDLLFTDESLTPFKTIFDEGEDFVAFINWTDDSFDPLNDTVGNCNLTLVGGLSEEIGTNDNFTICGTGCDFATYTEQFTQETLTNAFMDSFHAFVCNEQLQQQDAEVNISCVGGLTSYFETRTGAEIPLCADGFAFVSINTSVCIGELDINISATYNGIFNRRKRVVNLSIDREYTAHTITSTDGSNLFFNGTMQLWQTNETHEYYEHGAKTIWGNCTHDTTSDYDNSTTETITIINKVPEIFISQLNQISGVTDLSDFMVLINYPAQWEWLIAYVDDDLQTHNITWYDSSDAAIFSVQDLNFTHDHGNTTANLFAGLNNPYNLTTWVNDSFGNITYAQLIFNVTNITAPAPVVAWPLPASSHMANVTEFNVTLGQNETLAFIRYSIDGNETNTTVTIGDNVTGLITGEGTFTWYWHEGDIYGINTSVATTFSVDVVPPVPTIHEPIGEYTNISDINLNITIVEGGVVTGCLWSLNGASNVSYGACDLGINTTFNGSVEGPNTGRFCTNDTTNQFGCASTSYNVSTQVNTLLVLPQEETYLTTEVINITGFCRYTNSTLCGSDVSCRATSFYPNSTEFFTDEFMTFSEQGRYNYERGASTVIGEYSSMMSCYDGQTSEQAFTFIISGTDPVETSCLYKMFGYYNERVPFIRSPNC